MSQYPVDSEGLKFSNLEEESKAELGKAGKINDPLFVITRIEGPTLQTNSDPELEF